MFHYMLVIFVANVCIVWVLKKRKSSHISHRLSTIETKCKKENKVTIMLVIMTFVFLVLVLPWFVWHMYRYSVLNYKTDRKTEVISRLAWTICLKLWYSNNAVNSYVYALFGTEFRKELRKLFMRKNRVGLSTPAE